MTEVLTLVCDEHKCTESHIKGKYYKITACNGPSNDNNIVYHICRIHSLGSFLNRKTTEKKHINYTIYLLNR